MIKAAFYIYKSIAEDNYFVDETFAVCSLIGKFLWPGDIEVTFAIFQSRAAICTTSLTMQ